MNSTFIPYEEKIVWGLKIGFRGVIFPGSGCIYLETVQYGCFCLKITEIVANIMILFLYRRRLVKILVSLKGAYKIDRTHMGFSFLLDIALFH